MIDEAAKFIERDYSFTMSPRVYNYVKSKVDTIIAAATRRFQEIDFKMATIRKGTALYLDIGGGLYQLVCVEKIKDAELGEIVVSYATSDPSNPVGEKVVNILDLITLISKLT